MPRFGNRGCTSRRAGCLGAVQEGGRWSRGSGFAAVRGGGGWRKELKGGRTAAGRGGSLSRPMA